MEHLKTHPAVSDKLRQGQLIISGWYYEFEYGEVYIYNEQKKKFIPFEETVKEVAQAKIEALISEELTKQSERVASAAHATAHNPHFFKRKPVRHFPELSTTVELIQNKFSETIGPLFQQKNGTPDSRFTDFKNEIKNAVLSKFGELMPESVNEELSPS